jgi:putative FmdB family regulatory protein
MAGYLYRCERCGPWEVQRPIGTAESTSTCPVCGTIGRRLFTPPLLARTPTAMARARLHEEASRDAPEVATAVPPQRSRPAPRDPRWSKLPRP